MTENELIEKYNSIKKRIDELEFQNKMRKQKIEEHRETIKSLGFNPDNLNEEIAQLRLKISKKLTDFNAKLNEVEQNLDAKA